MDKLSLLVFIFTEGQWEDQTVIHVKGFSTAPIHVIISKAQFRAQGKVSTNVNRMDDVWKVPWKLQRPT